MKITKQQVYVKEFSGLQVSWITIVFFVLIDYLIRSNRFSDKFIGLFAIISTFYITSSIFGLKDRKKRK